MNINGKLVMLEKMKNSLNGNPRYMMLIEDTVFYTRVDSSYGYSVPNFEGKEVNVNLSYHYGKLCLDTIDLM